MPTNAQMEKADELEAARIRIKLIREGLLEQLDGGSKTRVPPRIRALAWAEPGACGSEKAPDFHIPAARRIRHSTPGGVTSFHFAHGSVSKVTYSTVIEGVRHQPGAARSHYHYIARESAVSQFTADEDRDLELRPDHELEAEAADRSSQGSVPPLTSEAIGSAPSFRPGDEECASQDRREASRRRDQSALEADAAHDDPGADSASLTSQFDDYLVRPSAVAAGPGQTRALISNISDDDEERAEFWKLVEEHERKPSPDKMVFRRCDFPEFWDAVIQHPECPPQIKKKLAGPERDSDKPFEVGRGKKVRAFLRKQPGWVKRSDRPMASFIDGRGGRTQYRINGELPEELTPAQNFELLKDFSKVFEKRGMPFVSVMHAPDHQNDDRNWHFHLIYTDRPARRITQTDIDALSKDFDVAGLSPGQWDFSVKVPKLARTDGRLSSPLRQKKVAEVSRSQGWPRKLRVALAKVTNQHLALAGVARRVSPDTFADLGIAADPQEHLGTTLNAKETRGVATQRGIKNEEKQWRAIEAQVEARYRSDIEAANARVAAAMRGHSSPDARTSSEEKSLREELERAALLKRNAVLLQHELERAASRARMVRERNLKLLKAEEAKANPVSGKRMTEYRSLIGKATRYLAALEESTLDEIMLAVRWHSSARKCEERAKAIEAELAKGRTAVKEQARVASLQSSGEPHRLPAQRSDPGQPNPTSSPSQEEIEYMAAARRRVEAMRERIAQEEAAAQTENVDIKPASSGDEAKAQPRRPGHQMPPPGYDFGR